MAHEGCVVRTVCHVAVMCPIAVPIEPTAPILDAPGGVWAEATGAGDSLDWASAAEVGGADGGSE